MTRREAREKALCLIYEYGYNTEKKPEELIEDSTEDILLLSDLQNDMESADAKTLLLLMQLRDIERKSKRVFNITSQMCSVSYQKLAKVANVDDFVVGSKITNLMLTQVSENR
jgi:transcription termination factor NusB